MKKEDPSEPTNSIRPHGYSFSNNHVDALNMFEFVITHNEGATVSLAYNPIQKMFTVTWTN